MWQRGIFSQWQALGEQKKFDALSQSERLCPFIAAYTGCRMGEAVQLRGSDFERRDCGLVMVIKPEAGSVKSKRSRVVPVAGHVLELGLEKWIAERGTKALFYDPDGRRSDDATSPVRSQVAGVRGVTDCEVSPDHAWRHTFKLQCHLVGISEKISDYVTGHQQASVGRSYGAPNIDDMARELGKFPRYQI